MAGPLPYCRFAVGAATMDGILMAFLNSIDRAPVVVVSSSLGGSALWQPFFARGKRAGSCSGTRRRHATAASETRDAIRFAMICRVHSLIPPSWKRATQ
jgi:hypothetical protein